MIDTIVGLLILLPIVIGGLVLAHREDVRRSKKQ
jgi:hypothetical protein